ncbi:MAG: RICIN domain-containing protein, partial [Spirochaetota bacterium]
FVNGAGIFVYANDGGRDQQFRFMPAGNGYYYIISANGGAARISGGRDGDGVPLQIGSSQGSGAEKFRFRHLGGGRWKIYTPAGRAVCLASRSHAHGSAVHTWGDHDGAWMEWRIVRADTRQPYVPASSAAALPSTGEIFRLASGEEMVFGKIGTDNDGGVRYTFAVVRKTNPSKTVYNAELRLPYGGSDPVLGGRRSVVKAPEKFDLYDFWIIFNGKKYGPYDRIYEMGLQYSDIDKWVSSDGKSIRFLAAVGDRYDMYLGGERQPVALGSITVQRIYSSLPEKKVMAVQRGTGNYDLLENGQVRLKGWKLIDRITYSDDGKNLFYVGAEDSFDKKCAYLNHVKIAGPFSAVNLQGFIPGTGIPYFNGSNTGKDPSLQKAGFYVGDGSVDVYPGTAAFRNNALVFSGLTGSTYSICEYNYAAKKMKKSGSYTMVSEPVLSDSWVYFSVHASNGDRLLVRQDGTVMSAMKKAQYKSGAVSFAVAPNDDIYTLYSVTQMGPLTVLKNGKPFAAAAKPFSGSSITFEKDTGKMRMHLSGDGRDRFIYGDRTVDVSDLLSQRIMAFAPLSSDVFYVRKMGKNIFTSSLKIYKNAELLDDRQWAAVSDIIVSPDGSRYAALVIEQLTTEYYERKYAYYWTQNDLMDLPRQLVVDGKSLGSGCGLPVWSGKKNRFIFLKQENGAIRISEQ